MIFDQFIPLLLLIIVVPSLLILMSNIHKPKEKLPPSPKKLPFLGNLHQLLGDLPHVALHKLSNKHGPIMLLQLGCIPTLVISSSNIVREIFQSHDLIFSGRPSLYAPRRLSYDHNDITFAPYGEYWRQIRKITILELLSNKRVQSFHVARDEGINFVIDSIVKCSMSSKPVNLSQLTMSLANNVICHVAFGRSFGHGHDQGNKSKANVNEILRETQHLLGEFNVADYRPWLGWFLNKINEANDRLEKSFKELDELYDKIIEEHVNPNRDRINNDYEDLVDVLLRLQKDQSQSMRLNNNQVKGILTDMFIAGSDTSAATLVWAMSELIKNPSIMKQAQNEVRSQVIAKGKQMVEESDLPTLTYLKLVIKETFRLHPPAPLLVPRETIDECTIRGYKIPKKTRVIINAKAISMDQNVWPDIDPNIFDPHRFLNNSIDYKGLDFEFIPFGFGRRGCPGINFATLLIELTLASLLFRFDWSLPKGMTRDDIDMVEDVGLTSHKKNPLLLFATPHMQPQE